MNWRNLVYKKLITVLNKNKKLKIISKISNILKGQKNTNHEILDIIANYLVFFKKPLITSVNVQKTFAINKSLLLDNRLFLFENLMRALTI